MKIASTFLALVLVAPSIFAADDILWNCGIVKDRDGQASKSAPELQIVKTDSGIGVKEISLDGTNTQPLILDGQMLLGQKYTSADYVFTTLSTKYGKSAHITQKSNLDLGSNCTQK